MTQQTRLEQVDAYIKEEYAEFAGKKLLCIRVANQAELDEMGWDEYHPTIIMLFEGGLSLTVSQDEEGNGPGFLFIGECG